MRDLNALSGYAEPRNSRIVGPRIRTIFNLISAAYRDKEYYYGDRKNGWGDTRPGIDIPRYAKLHKLGWLKLREQIIHRFSHDAINRAVESVRKGNVTRCIIAIS